MGWLHEWIMVGTLGISLALHGLFLSASARKVPASPPLKPRLELVEVELAERRSPPPPASPANRADLTRPTPLPQPPPAPVRRPRPPPPPPQSQLPSDVPRSEPSPEALDAPRLPLALVPFQPFAPGVDAGIERDDSDRSPRRPLGASALVAALAKETLGRGRVERGLVHPYYAQLGKALIKHWDADRVAGAGLKGFGEQMSANFKLLNDVWLERAAAFGRSGAPLEPSPTGSASGRRAAVSDQIKGISGIDLEAKKELHRTMAEQFKATRRATIRVVQDVEGRLKKVELVEPSNDEKVDREALVDVKAAAEKLPPPPPEALEGKAELSSLWSFELIVSISPPVPTFSFEFDEALGFIDARLPLDRRIYKKVRLVSVE